MSTLYFICEALRSEPLLRSLGASSMSPSPTPSA